MLINGIFYILLGCIFTYIAIYHGDNNIWGIRTLLPTLFATFDFGLGIRLFLAYFKMQKDKKDTS